MAGKSKVGSKLSIIFLVFTLLACPYMFLGSLFFPKMLNVLGPVLCPGDMKMEISPYVVEDQEGNSLRSNVECRNGQVTKNVDWKVTLFMLGIPTLGVVVFFLTPTAKKEPEKIVMNPDGIE